MILQTHDLIKRYGQHTVLNSVTMSVDEGSIYGLVGPNGAGKTTILSIIAGLRQPTSGQVTLSVSRQEIAVCPDVPEFEPWLTALELMQLAASLVGVSRPDSELIELLNEAGLGDAVNRTVGGFSRGMTQRLALAATIVGKPKLIILDEPCAALDPNGRVEVLDMIARLGARSTVLFSSHILADVQRVCDTIGVLKEGKILYEGNLQVFLDKNIKPIWDIQVRDNIKSLEQSFHQQKWVTNTEQISPGKLRVEATTIAAFETGFAKVLAESKTPIISIVPVDSDLEHAFLALTGSKETTK